MRALWKLFKILFVIAVCLEIALQIYNPFSGRVKNGEIVLPKNTQYTTDLPQVQGLDSQLIHTKNSMGFRGEELTDSNAIKILCMGGSTTECYYLSDGKDWPNLLGKKLQKTNPKIWLNNAGMDGQSSFGNLQMLKQYILQMHPNYIILMCGLNDMSLDEPSKFDQYDGTWFKKLYNKLELPSTILNIIRAGKAKDAGLNHQFIDDITSMDTMIMNDSQILHRLEKEQKYIGPYKNRLREFADLCKQNHIQLIFVAQSILFSDEKDLLTNVYLGHLRTGEINGKARSLILKMYNKSTYDVANEKGVPFINLAARLPKDSRFYYDGYHFTNDGADFVAAMIGEELISKKLIPLK
ncbi:MAG: SGNH/GDSL hydrolase family protein [Bacteroidia bacterium]|nr:SGNH/GDSL hydrolase family protein [Bacteroidia bacterium]